MSGSSSSPGKIDPAWGERLKCIRDGLGMSQAEFAETLGLSKRSYVFWEMGEREPPYRLLIVLQQTYNVDPSWVLMGPGVDVPSYYSKNIDPERLRQAFRLVDDALNSGRVSSEDGRRFDIVAAAYRFADRPEDLRALLDAAFSARPESSPYYCETR